VDKVPVALERDSATVSWGWIDISSSAVLLGKESFCESELLAHTSSGVPDFVDGHHDISEIRTRLATIVP
jgi:hypothetical protein